MSTDTPAQQFHNPWRESLENCISGDNYLRASEYHELIAELDELYRLRAASPQPTAAQPLTDEQIDAVALHAVYDDDDTCAYRDAWCREVGRPFARAIERAHGIGASAAPAQAAPNYAGPKDCPDEAWELALKVRADLDRISCPGVYMDKAVDAICKRWSAAPVAELVEALRIFVGCALPVSTEIDKRGHRWTEAYLDQALPIGIAALERAALSRAPGAQGGK